MQLVSKFIDCSHKTGLIHDGKKFVHSDNLKTQDYLNKISKWTIQKEIKLKS